MKKYIKPQLKVLSYKLDMKPICAEAMLSANNGIGSQTGIFRPIAPGEGIFAKK